MCDNHTVVVIIKKGIKVNSSVSFSGFATTLMSFSSEILLKSKIYMNYRIINTINPNPPALWSGFLRVFVVVHKCILILMLELGFLNLKL